MRFSSRSGLKLDKPELAVLSRAADVLRGVSQHETGDDDVQRWAADAVGILALVLRHYAPTPEDLVEDDVAASAADPNSCGVRP